ncbi:MAG: beta-N-acetylglucosaminidase domain-containing protein [Pseudomonadota bacterium]
MTDCGQAPRPAKLGVIEGFYGKPWPGADRLNFIRELSATGASFYYYAPKADRSLRRNWQQSFSAAQRGYLGSLRSACADDQLEFGIGFSPHQIWESWDTATRHALADKLHELAAIEIDTLCVLFDDMHGAKADLARLQIEIVDYVADHARVQHLVVCPTYYSLDETLDRVFGERPADYLQRLGEGLDGGVDVFWTGPQVASAAVSDAHLDEIGALLRRPPFLWDNVFANDGRLASQFLNLDVERHTVLPNRNKLAGIAVNPMNQVWLSRHVLTAFAAKLGAVGKTSQLPSGTAALLKRYDREFRQLGLPGLAPDCIRSMLTEFAPFADQREAAEVIAWLGGEFAFDPECLTD